MADELHTPNHRWYQGRYHIPLAKEDHSKQWIFDSGIQKIDAWIAFLSGASAYAINSIVPPMVIDFTNEFYWAESALSDLEALAGIANLERGGLATMVNAAGNLVWNPHNLLLRSEEFDETPWIESGLTVADNTTVAPNGGNTADKLVEDSSANSHFVFQTLTATSGVTYTGVVYAKAAGRSVLQISPSGNWLTTPYANYDLSSVTVTASSANVSAAIEPVGNGWYRCAATFTPTSTASGGFAFILQNSPTAARGATYTGDGTSGIYLWGAHLYRSDLGGMAPVPSWARGLSTSDTYLPTTSAARYLKRDGHHVNGVRGMLVEPTAGTNLNTRFIPDNTNWFKGDVVVTENVSGQTAPDGTETFTRFIESAAPGVHFFSTPSTSFTSGTTYTFSGFVKKATTDDIIQLTFPSAAFGSSQYANFNAGAGAFGTSVDVTTHVEDWGGGLYLVGITAAATSTASGPAGFVLTDNNDGLGRTPSYTGDNTNGFYVWGAQTETNSVPTSRIPTSGATVTRLADTNGLPIQSSSLPWPTPNVIGPELVTNGTFDTDTDWTKGTGWTISGGLANASSATSGLYQALSLTSGKSYAVTFTISGYSAGSVRPRLIGGTTATGTSRSANGAYTEVLVAQSGNIGVDITGTGFTGSIDNISVREIDPLAVSIQMDGKINYVDSGSNTEAYFVYWLKSLNEFITQQLSTDVGGSGSLRTAQAQSGVVDIVGGTNSFSPGINVPFHIASRHGSTFINGAVDGTALTADTTPVALPDLSTTVLNLGSSGGPMFIEKFVLWDKDLGDAGIAEASEGEPSSYLLWDATADTYIQRIYS